MPVLRGCRRISGHDEHSKSIGKRLVHGCLVADYAYHYIVFRYNSLFSEKVIT